VWENTGFNDDVRPLGTNKKLDNCAGIYDVYKVTSNYFYINNCMRLSYVTDSSLTLENLGGIIFSSLLKMFVLVAD